MREIKFRGRNTKHQKRIYGDYLNNRGRPLIVQGNIALIGTYILNPLIGGGDWLAEYGSVGQSTGLFDKNGKEIYEGDIIYCEINKAKAIVKYNDKIGQYRFHFFSGGREDLKRQSKYHGTDMSSWFISTGDEIPITVIGNIHENPELINR